MCLRRTPSTLFPYTTLFRSPMQLPMTWFQAFVSNILRALNLVWRCSRNLTVASVIIVLIQSLLPLAGLYLMKRVVDEVTAQQRSEEHTSELQSLTNLVCRLL